MNPSAVAPAPRMRPGLGDVWGGLTAMLVALPAAIGFGVTVFSAIGPGLAAQGALAGVIGAVLMGTVAAALGGTARLVSAPCAPAAALLSAYALEMAGRGEDPALIVALLLGMGLLAGLIQLVLGLIGAGRLIQYVPYPVVSGYLSGVGLLLIGSQLPRLLGLPAHVSLWTGLAAPANWDWRALSIGLLTAAVMSLAARRQTRLPATLLGIAAGTLVYLLLSVGDASMRSLTGNSLVLGPLDASGTALLDGIAARWSSLGGLDAAHLSRLAGGALTLAVLLSIDTLKTCVVLDKLTLSRHDSNRELLAQGAANIATAACGGISGAGTLGATLVGLNSGAKTRATGLMQGLFALAAAVLLGHLIAWIPVATLAGILVAIGLRMLDGEPLRFLRSRATVLDLLVVIAVIVVTLAVGLVEASVLGVALSMLLFVREQSSASVVRQKLEMGRVPSTWHRPGAEMAMLARRSSAAVIFRLQGTLFFGNTYRLYGDLEQEIQRRRFVILDFKHVHSIDVTAAQLFLQVRDAVHERGARLLLCNAQDNGDRGSHRRHLLAQFGLLQPGSATVRVFDSLDDAIGHVEEALLRESGLTAVDEIPLDIAEVAMFASLRRETLDDLQSALQLRRYESGQIIYAQGAAGDELFWVRRGGVRLLARLPDGTTRPMAGFGRGDYFGGLSFLDKEPRPHDAVALGSTEVWVLSRSDFDALAERHHRMAYLMASAMARTLAARLRRAQDQLVTLDEY